MDQETKEFARAFIISWCIVGAFVAIVSTTILCFKVDWVCGAIGYPIITLGIFAMKPMWPIIKSLIKDPI